MMSIRETIAKIIAPALKGDAEIRTLVAEEIRRAKMDFPIMANIDPKNEGYRRYGDSMLTRNLFPMQQSRMFEIAYYMFDASAMFRRLGILDRSFLFSGRIKVTSEDADVQDIITKFWNDPENKMDLNYPESAMWLSFLGEQCWPVTVNPYNGQVRLGYMDPSLIKDIYVNPMNVKQIMQVETMGLTGRMGDRYAVIRKDYNFNSKTYDRLVGDCFFFSINHPPNSPRGRSDYLTLFDWIDAVERYGYNCLDRSEYIMNFIWDVTLKGMTQEQIDEWQRKNPPPEANSVRAHNENVTWEAVAPDLKNVDNKAGFDLGKSFVMGAAGRPASWFGEGGKAYQTEADQFGQVPIADMEQRQDLHRFNIEYVIQFVLDQAVIAGRLSAEKAAAGFTVSMPEVSKKDVSKMVNGLPQLAAALVLAVTNKLQTRETATRIYSWICGYLGYEVDAQAEIDKVLEEEKSEPTPDNTNYDQLLTDAETALKEATAAGKPAVIEDTKKVAANG
jgi:hypothetical protein